MSYVACVTKAKRQTLCESAFLMLDSRFRGNDNAKVRNGFATTIINIFFEFL